MRFFRLLLAGVAAVALLMGCGGGDDAASGEEQSTKDLTQLQLTLESRANPEDAGVLLGDRLGYFADAGINLYVLGPATPSQALSYADQGTDIVMSPLPQVVMAQAEGEPVVAVGTAIPEATMSMIWLPDSGVEKIADLKGKKIATPGLSFHREALRVVLEKAGLKPSDVKVSEVAYSDDLVSKLERGNVDAIFGGSWNVEGAALEAAGLEPMIAKATDLGIPGFDELVFVAERGRYAKKPELLEGFLEAAYRGAAAVKKDPAAGGQAVVDKSLEFVSPREGEAGAEATAPLYAENATIDRKQAANLVDWMYEEGMIERRIPVSALLASP